MFNADDIVAFICLKVLTFSFQMSSVSPMSSCPTFAVVSAVYIERSVRHPQWFRYVSCDEFLAFDGIYVVIFNVSAKILFGIEYHNALCF